MNSADLVARMKEERDRHVIGYPGPRRNVAELLDNALDRIDRFVARIEDYETTIARLQEQVETLTIQLRVVKLDRDGAVKRMCGAEAERDRLREMTLRAADQCDKWVKETYDGGWSTHQVRGQCALAESLRLAAKGEAE